MRRGVVLAVVLLAVLAAKAEARAWRPSVVGFFCAARPVACLDLPARQPDQALVWNLNASPCDTGAVLLVTRGNRQFGGYVDDSLGTREAPDQACAQRSGLRVWAGEQTFGSIANYPMWHSPQLPGGLQEWYPVRRRSTPVGLPPPAGKLGYILQAFSWSDTPEDRAVMGDSNQTPGAWQERQMWCAALANHPRVVLWYYATRWNVRGLLRLEQQPCPTVRAAGRPASQGG